MKKLISPGLSPNLEWDDVLLSIKLLFRISSLRLGDCVSKVEAWFRYNYDKQYVFSFSSGREALYATLMSARVKDGDEVLIQSFTCSAAVFPILWCGAKPIFVDIDIETLSMNLSDLKKKITKSTKAIILQHTFAIPGQIEEVKKIALQNKLFLVEDCAHTIGGVVGDRKLGTFGDAAIFSFGRDKACSSVFGGVVITNIKKIGERLSEIKMRSPFPSYIWIYQQLFHPIITYVVLKGFGIHGKLGGGLLFAFKKLHLISKPILDLDNRQFLGKGKLKRFPNSLACLALQQILKSNKFNKRRKEIALLYSEKLSAYKKYFYYTQNVYYLRFPFFYPKPSKLIDFFRQEKIILGNWYSHVIDPADTNLEAIGYKKGSCRNAEKISQSIVNLPCYPTMRDEDVDRVAALLQTYLKRFDRYVKR